MFYLHRLKMGKSREVCALVRTEWNVVKNDALSSKDLPLQG
jgi:hypothetical protein